MLKPVVLSLLPLALFAYFASLIGILPEAVSYQWAWVESVGLNVDFRIDGLALLMSLLISGIGFFIYLYGGAYLKGHPSLNRFYLFLTVFMLAMLGVVVSDNLIFLFVCWELTSVSSYMLIGFNHSSQKSRDSALMALLTTGIGGLALLAGFVMIGHHAGTFQISQILLQGDSLTSSNLYPLMAGLVLLGALTKSAQFPFHYWLPNAMAGPTPVSAYLHSATMVKAGIFLIARMTPALGGTDFWNGTLTILGAITVILAAWMSFGQKDIKGILAYTTLAALGTLTVLLGLGTPKAYEAFLYFIFAHALYKASFFMIAGTVDHETGTRDLSKLGGLSKLMPQTAWAAVLVGVAFAGLPPTFSFIAKETGFEATLRSPFPMISTAALWLGAVAFVYLTAILVHTVFFSRPLNVEPADASVRKEKIHDGNWPFWIGPWTLGVLGLFFGIFPKVLSGALLEPTSLALLGFQDSYKPSLWHGINAPLLLTVAAVALAIFLYSQRDKILGACSKFLGTWKWGMESVYKAKVASVPVWSPVIFNFFQNGYLRFYVAAILFSASLILTVPMLAEAMSGQLDLSLATLMPVEYWKEVTFMEVALVFSIIIAASITLWSRKTFVALAATGVAGLGVGAFYVFYSAPDLAITQVLVEALSLILIVLVLFHFPRLSIKLQGVFRALSYVLAAMISVVLAYAALLSLKNPYFNSISEYHSTYSYMLAKGKNVVNVILVDFRAWDTFGEVAVLAIAAMGVYALIRFKKEGGDKNA